MNEDLYLEQIQIELNAFGLNEAANRLSDPFYKEFSKELAIIETTLSKWIAIDGKAERFERSDPKVIKTYSADLANKVNLSKLSKVIFAGIISTVNKIHDQPNGKSDNGNPHFQMLINNVILVRSLPAVGFPYNSEIYPIKHRLTFWTKVLHNVLLELHEVFTIYKGQATSKTDSGYWLIKFTDSGKQRIEEYNVDIKFAMHKPMIVPPNPYTSATSGGYITREMESINPLSRHHEHIPEKVLEAINKAQNVAFVINKQGIINMDKLIHAQKVQLKLLKAEKKALRASLIRINDEISNASH